MSHKSSEHTALSWWHTFMHALLIERAVSGYNLQIGAAHWVQLGTAGYTCPVSTTTTASPPGQACPHWPTQLLRCQLRPDGSLHITIAHLSGLTWHVIGPHTDTSPRSSYNNGQDTQFTISRYQNLKIEGSLLSMYLPNILRLDHTSSLIWFPLVWASEIICPRLRLQSCDYIYITATRHRASSHGHQAATQPPSGFKLSKFLLIELGNVIVIW